MGGDNAANGGNGRIVFSYTPSAVVPEPATLVLLALGGTLVTVQRRRKKV